jgi:hypothetical protein
MATCLDCPTPLAPTNKSGRCTPCGNRHREADPEFRARRLAGIRKSFEDPARRAVAAETMRRSGRKALDHPGHREWLIERGKRIYRDILTRPDVRAKNAQAVREARAARAERELAWCPPEYRELLETLKRSKKLPAAEARKVIEAKAKELEALRHRDFGGVVHFMQRLTSVTRCNERGVFDPAGTHYRVGNAILTPGELLRRAEARGYGERMAA